MARGGPAALPVLGGLVRRHPGRSQEIKLEIAGSSEDSIEGAVSDALAEASTVLPGLKRVETTALEADIDDGQVSRWHVKLKAVLDRRA